MWVEIQPVDNITALNTFATLRNEYGCSTNYTGMMLKGNIENKIDCHYYVYNTPEFTILLGFKFNQGFELITLMCFTFIVNNVDDYPTVLSVVAQKIKDYLLKKDLNLLNEYNWEELEETNYGIKQLGYNAFFDMFKKEAEKIGLNVNFDETKLEVSL